MQRVQEEAKQRGHGITSTVFRFNPGSLRFHKRLGFNIVREDEMYFYMEWKPLPTF